MQTKKGKEDKINERTDIKEKEKEKDEERLREKIGKKRMY